MLHDKDGTACGFATAATQKCAIHSKQKIPFAGAIQLKRRVGNKGKTWADQFMACLIACVPQSTYVDSPTS